MKFKYYKNFQRYVAKRVESLSYEIVWKISKLYDHGDTG